MQTSTIKFSQIEDRIDAEYYKPEYLILNSKLKVQNSKFLDDLSQIITKGETPLWRGDVYISKGIPFLRVVNFINEELDLSDIVYIPEFVHERMKRSQLKPGDVLLSMAGRIGTAVIVLEELKVANINQAIAKIRLKEGLINKYYLIVFLNSKYGLYQSLRKASGGVQNNINFEDIKSIKIPTPSQSFQQKIEKMVKEAQEKRKLADEKYKEVEEILNKELRLKDLDLSTQKTFEAKFSEIWDRIDPEYYQPIFNEIEKIFKKQKTVNLGDISLEIKYGTSEDLFYVEKGIPFLRVTDINKFSNIEPIEGKFINNFDAERLKEYQVETDDIIISRTGTLGLAVYIDEKLDGAIYGSYFIKVKPRHKDLNNRFITFFISSKIGRLQTNRWASGGIQTNLTIDAIKSIRIPILSWSIQQKIVSLIQESFNLRREAKELIDRARKEVEEMVEND